MYEGFQLQYEQKRVDKEKNQKEKLFQNVDEFSWGRKNNTINLAFSRKEDKDILYDKYSMEKESQKKENELEEKKINSETEMVEISEGNEEDEVEIDDRIKEKKKRTRLYQREGTSQAKAHFLIKQ